jgi:nucleoid DNA-binding protein
MTSTNATVIQDAILCNEINKKGMLTANKGKSINRSIILSNYTKEAIDDCWESLTLNVIQNYQRGKGTYIKGFGTFTYKKRSINLEGTTYEYFRCKREEEPVFIVSKELNNECLPGEYTKLNTIKVYTQKENKNIPILKINYSEIAYRLSMSKDEVENILHHLIKNIGESISTGEFKNKIMPNLGVLFCKYKIIAIKFDKEFISSIKDKNEILNKTKKNILMEKDLGLNRTFSGSKIINTFYRLDELKARNSLNTRIEKSGYDYLINKYNIDVENFPQHEIKNIYNSYEQNTGKINFINDYKPKKIITRNKQNISLNQSPIFNLDQDIINSFEYYKELLILNLKRFDIYKNGKITKEEAVNAILHSNISDKIDNNIAKSIVDYYNKTENVDYMKFVAHIIKDVQNCMNNDNMMNLENKINQNV